MKKVIEIVQVWDDLDLREGIETEAEETVQLEFNGRRVELDLTAKHREQLDELLAPLLEAGTKVAGSRSAAALRRPDPSGFTARPYRRAIREWADAHGRSAEYMNPGGTFRYPKHLVDDFEADMARQSRAAG